MISRGFVKVFYKIGEGSQRVIADIDSLQKVREFSGGFVGVLSGSL